MKRLSAEQLLTLPMLSLLAASDEREGTLTHPSSQPDDVSTEHRTPILHPSVVIAVPETEEVSKLSPIDATLLASVRWMA